MAERKESVASMVAMREAMRLEFYQFLFLEKQKKVNSRLGIAIRKGEGNKWKWKGLWKRLFGKQKRAEKEEMGSLGQN